MENHSTAINIQTEQCREQSELQQDKELAAGKYEHLGSTPSQQHDLSVWPLIRALSLSSLAKQQSNISAGETTDLHARGSHEWNLIPLCRAVISSNDALTQEQTQACSVEQKRNAVEGAAVNRICGVTSKEEGNLLNSCASFIRKPIKCMISSDHYR